MNRINFAIPAVAFMLAACGTAASSSGAGTTTGSVNSGYVQVNSQNAGTSLQGNSDVNSVNLPPKKPGSSQVVAPRTNNPTTVVVAPTPAFGTAQDRCGGGIGSSGGGNRAGATPAKGVQLPACMPQ
jgi:hypothetical protein